jgi:hypothetical protein
MNRSVPIPASFAPTTEDELMDFQLRVARRADELSQSRGRHTQTDLERWLDAERDVLASFTLISRTSAPAGNASP